MQYRLSYRCGEGAFIVALFPALRAPQGAALLTDPHGALVSLLVVMAPAQSAFGNLDAAGEPATVLLPAFSYPVTFPACVAPIESADRLITAAQ